jgi:uncharacterized SAM-binding protein YcdF (DUF218 family)
MLFYLAAIVGAFSSPSQILFVLTVAGTVLLAWRRRRWGLRLLYAGVGGFVLLAVLPVDRWMIAPLENRFPQVTSPPAHVDGIIVLGGAVDPQRTADHGIPALSWAAERMTTFAGLARRYPDAKLVFTGGSVELKSGIPTEAEVARTLFTELGVDQKRMIYEDTSRTTFENAENSYRLVNPKPGEVWILVTSANHMPRSVGVFRHVGWKVLPWPVAFKTPYSQSIAVLGYFVTHLAIVDLAFHEWAGAAVYYLTGRSDTLFPGP